MELFGGLMVMMSILFFFLSVIWFVLPFVIFSMKGKVDRSLDVLEQIERRLATVEARLTVEPLPMISAQSAVAPDSLPCGSPQPSDGG